MPDTTSISQAPLQATDSVAPAAMDVAAPFEAKHCHREEGPTAAHATGAWIATGRVGFADGLAPVPRPQLPGYDTGVMCLLIGTFLVLAANFRHYSTFVKTFAQDLWKVRNRDNVFTDHTMSETRVIASFILLLCLCEGIIIFSLVAPHAPGLHIFGGVAMFTLLSGAFYWMQQLSYQSVGYSFTSTDNARQWLKGFRASQSLLGVTLVVPAMIVLFNPGMATAIALLSATLYIMARIIFILKGFRIFYDNSFSLIYFILYLCTLEIVPPIAMCRVAVYIAKLFAL